MNIKYCRQTNVVYINEKRDKCVEFAYSYCPWKIPDDIKLLDKNESFLNAIIPSDPLIYECYFKRNMISYAWKAFWFEEYFTTD